MTGAYHSALDSEISLSHGRHAPVKAAGSFVCVHDLLGDLPLPRTYERCDVFYSDLPWHRGFAVFERRARRTSVHRTHLQLIRAVLHTISGLAPRPVVMICGKYEARRLTGASEIRQTTLNGARAQAVIFNRLHVAIDFRSAGTIIAGLAEHYQCVGDFMCGYGRVGRAFRARGKCFVMSDYNPRCVGYVADWMT